MIAWFGAAAVWALMTTDGPGAWAEHFSAAEALVRSGNYVNALHEFDLALRYAEDFPEHDPRLAVTLTNAGIVEARLGLFSQAERSYRRAISIYEQYHPDLQSGLATILHDFAALDVARRRWSSAEKLYRRAYDLEVKARGTDHPSVAKSLNAMGELAQEMRRYGEAENFYLEALRIFRGASGEGSLASADLEHNLATLYRETGRLEDSGGLFERAIAAYERTAPKHPNFAIVLRNYAELEADLRNPVGAEAAFRRALAICDAALTPDSPETGIILQAYSRFLFKMKRKAEAKEVAEKARKILEQSFREAGGRNVVDWRELRNK